MTERKEFPCPSCGGASYLNQATLLVEHSEPHCAAWIEVQGKSVKLGASASSSANQQGMPTFSQVDFKCPECDQPVQMFPLSKPIGVQHSLPVCKLWETIEAKTDDVERYLIKAGVHIHVPTDRG